MSPLLLAVESATACLSVALLRGDVCVAERMIDAPGHHAERILPLIETVLGEAGCGPEDPAAFGVSIGPGSFTSLRVGLATVKGLAFGTPRPVVPVPTLEALAFGCLEPGEDTPIVVLLDARRGEVYAAIFEPEGQALRTLLPDGLFEPAELAARLPESCRLVGEGAALFGRTLRELAGEGVRLPSSDDAASLAPRASSVGRLALQRLERGEVGAIDLAPRYVRRAEAEVTRTGVAVEDPI